MTGKKNLHKAHSRTDINEEYAESTSITLMDSNETSLLNRNCSEMLVLKQLLLDIKDEHIRIREILEESQKDTSEENQVNFTNTLTNATNAIENLHTLSNSATTATATTEIPPSERQDNAEKIKSAITQKWSKNLEFRKHHYWQYIRNKLHAETYEEWLNSIPIVIPRKLQGLRIANESTTQTSLREKQITSNYKFEIEKTYD
ncbi:hypothetical protein ACF0H5_004483 [Mactra antiquata]